MSDQHKLARDFLRQAVEKMGGNAAALAKRAQLSPSTITRPLKDESSRFTPKIATLLKVAQATGLQLPAGISAVSLASPPLGADLPVLGPVQAGAWLAVDDLDQDEPRRIPAALDPRYPDADHYLLEVRGDSMNALTHNGRPTPIFDGDYVHCVCVTDIGYVPRTDDVVEFVRLRSGGHLREVTLKQVEVTRDGVLLWPRSTNSRWTTPVTYRDGADGEEEITGTIRGLVLTSIRRF